MYISSAPLMASTKMTSPTNETTYLPNKPPQRGRSVSNSAFIRSSLKGIGSSTREGGGRKASRSGSGAIVAVPAPAPEPSAIARVLNSAIALSIRPAVPASALRHRPGSLQTRPGCPPAERAGATALTCRQITSPGREFGRRHRLPLSQGSTFTPAECDLGHIQPGSVVPCCRVGGVRPPGLSAQEFLQHVADLISPLLERGLASGLARLAWLIAPPDQVVDRLDHLVGGRLLAAALSEQGAAHLAQLVECR